MISSYPSKLVASHYYDFLVRKWLHFFRKLKHNDITGPEYPWVEILSYLSGAELIRTSLVNRDMLTYAKDDSLWRSLTIKKLSLDDSSIIPVISEYTSWKELYLQLIEGVHSYCFRQKDKHIDWMSIGGFLVASGSVNAADTLDCGVKFPSEEVHSGNACDDNLPCSWRLTNVKTGIWVSDLHLVRCPICNLDTWTMQIMEARHIELFSMPGWRDNTGEYCPCGAHQIPFNTSKASVCIYDKEYLYSMNSKEIFEGKRWIGGPGDWSPRGIARQFAVAACTNLQENEGLSVKCEILRGAEQNEIVAIRVSQQLL